LIFKKKYLSIEFIAQWGCVLQIHRLFRSDVILTGEKKLNDIKVV